VLAAPNGRSAEAEIRDILERAEKPAKPVRLGDTRAALGRRVGVTHEGRPSGRFSRASCRHPLSGAQPPPERLVLKPERQKMRSHFTCRPITWSLYQ
jgi:plasmid stability protein